jgi:hypothetical protein
VIQQIDSEQPRCVDYSSGECHVLRARSHIARRVIMHKNDRIRLRDNACSIEKLGAEAA